MRDWLANKARDIDTATVKCEQFMTPPLIRTAGRMNIVFEDAREDGHTNIDLVVSKAWAANDAEADRQTRDPLRPLIKGV